MARMRRRPTSPAIGLANKLTEEMTQACVCAKKVNEWMSQIAVSSSEHKTDELRAARQDKLINRLSRIDFVRFRRARAREGGH